MEQKQWVDVIEWYIARGFQLIPLHLKHGKRPRDLGWIKLNYFKQDIILHVRDGGNVGCRLDVGDVVIDVDPRNGGAESLTRLKSHIKSDLLAYTTVRTGGGGFHVYCKTPPDVSLRETLPEYPGVEIKTLGRQVVIPFSKHPETGLLYEFERRYDVIKEAPPGLLDLYKFVVVAPKVTPDAQITPAELREHLAQMPAEAYPRNEEWFPVLAASYHSTGGAGLQEFLTWWGQAPGHDLTQEAAELTRRWNSLSTPAPSKRSVGSLLREVHRHQQLAKEDALLMLTATDVQLDPRDIKASVAQIAAVEHPVDREELLHTLKTESGQPLALLRAALKHELGRRKKVKQESVDDPTPKRDLPTELVSVVMSLAGEDRLVHAADQRYWKYTGTHWKPFAENLVSNLVLQAIESFRELDPSAKINSASLLASTQMLLRAHRAADLDLLNAGVAEIPSVVNVENGEIWVDKRTGEYTVHPHEASHGLTSCLPIEHDPEARCDRFDCFLREIFDPLPDTADVVRHVWEVIGYTLQPRKDLPGWYLLQGTGQNGKTVLLQVLGALLGNAVLFQNIGSFDTGKHAHSLADLVGKLALIDDDVRAHQVLPDDFLKKVAENKQLTANPKFQQPFQFRSCATVFLAANSWPQSRDLSLGMRRRVNVIPFRRQFGPKEIDPTLAQYIIDHELPGVLRQALDALRRLRCRRFFDVPRSCDDAMSRWVTNANQSKQFLDEQFRELGGASVPASEVWTEYQAWCVAAGIKRAYSRNGLLHAIRDLGFAVEKQDKVFCVHGLTSVE